MTGHDTVLVSNWDVSCIQIFMQDWRGGLTRAYPLPCECRIAAADDFAAVGRIWSSISTSCLTPGTKIWMREASTGTASTTRARRALLCSRCSRQWPLCRVRAGCACSRYSDGRPLDGTVLHSQEVPARRQRVRTRHTRSRLPSWPVGDRTDAYQRRREKLLACCSFSPGLWYLQRGSGHARLVAGHSSALRVCARGLT